MEISLRYFAAAGAAVGTDSETLELATGATVEDLVSDICARHANDVDLERLQRVLDLSSFLVNGKTADRSDVIPAGASVDVLPPFAGGGK